MKFFPASDPAIIYTGRIDFSNKKTPVFSHTGVNIKTNFSGKNIDIILSDTGNCNYYNVIIDNADPVVMNTSAGEKIYEIARGLKDTVHSIEIFKRTEASQGTTTFIGFNCDSKIELIAPNSLSRRMEFIGDSITCGYGNELATETPEDFHFTPKNENAWLAFGAITARNLHARYHAVAVSGKGLFRNNDGSEIETIPLIYDRIFPDKTSLPLWNFENYKPDIVVINLGTNDYFSQNLLDNLSQTQFDAAFSKAYINFIKKLRSNYGNMTKIICCVGPMIYDDWPKDKMSWTRIQKEISCLVSKLNNDGDANVYYFNFGIQLSPFGEDCHPSYITHKKMANNLTAFVKQLTCWN